ncbi:holin, SPP1 family [Amphibacillus marinus]|uniref:Holin, SPP1 family n=1 Tax=Amphibacillus marinus TaxID=872970 RepID=A0A1H8IWP5_9BACI|nr:phage holin [Amphibacillus marinus]SEN73190.1 holin, SPP1 family [Amphibacillus marinus]
MNLKGVSKSVWVRAIALFLVLVNLICIEFFGFQIIPFAETEIYEGVSIVVVTTVTIWTSWKNNSFTKKAQHADRFLE